MYEMITGEKPFGGASAQERMTQSLNLIPTPPSRKGACYSSALEELVMRCLAKESDARHESAVRVRYALRSVQKSAREPTDRSSKGVCLLLAVT